MSLKRQIFVQPQYNKYLYLQLHLYLLQNKYLES